MRPLPNGRVVFIETLALDPRVKDWSKSRGQSQRWLLRVDSAQRENMNAGRECGGAVRARRSDEIGDFVEECLLRFGANDPLHRLAVLEQDQRWD